MADSTDAGCCARNCYQPRARNSCARAEAPRARLASAADDFADEKLTADQLHRITARLRPQLEAAEAEARSVHIEGDLDERIVGFYERL